MKIKTITCHHSYNHGAMLQAYALVSYLQSLGHDVKVIDYHPIYQPECAVNFKFVPSRYNYPIINYLYCLAKHNKNKLEQRRRNVFEAFFNKFIPITDVKYCNIEDLNNNPPQGDLYIAGSDQIWNATFPNGKDPAYYLDFGSPKRKISYAASFATNILLSGTESFVTKMLNNFNSISVREYSGLQILNSLGFNGVCVVDPVFLLDTENWNKLVNNVGYNDNYILTYDYEIHNSQIGYVAKRLAKMYNCKLYSIGPYNLNYADKSYVDLGPDSFVSLIKNARCIVSNSFHASAFSIIYNKDFFVVKRKDGLNDRMRDLLVHYGILERMIDRRTDNSILFKHINYDKLNSILAKDIDYSKEFLNQEINCVK